MSNQPPTNEPWQQPPQQPYPGNQPYPQQPPMQPPPPKKPSFWKRRIAGMPMWLFVTIVIVAFIIATNAAYSKATSNNSTPIATLSTPTTAATATPTSINTPTPEWTTTHTFTGHTHGKTPFFTVSKGWRLNWSCTNSTVSDAATGAVGITAYDKSGRTLSGNSENPTVTTGHCPVALSPTTGTSAVQQYGGSMYLDVYATGDWTIQVQELK